MLHCNVATHIEGQKHDRLLQEKGGNGYPMLAFMDEAGEVLAKPSARTVTSFEVTNQNLLNLRAFEAKAKAGDKTVAADLALTRIDLGSIGKLDEAKQALADAGKLTPEQQKRADGLLLRFEMNALPRENRGPELAKWFAAGKIPSGDPRDYFTPIFDDAFKQKDTQLFGKALTEFKVRASEERVVPSQGRCRDEAARAAREVRPAQREGESRR